MMSLAKKDLPDLAMSGPRDRLYSRRVAVSDDQLGKLSYCSLHPSCRSWLAWCRVCHFHRYSCRVCTCLTAFWIWLTLVFDAWAIFDRLETRVCAEENWLFYFAESSTQRQETFQAFSFPLWAALAAYSLLCSNSLAWRWRTISDKG